MSFKKFKEERPYRFKEFDEVRVYIEDMSIDTNLTKEAVDYMITHKEYFFLLKNIVKQFYKGGGSRELFDYIFSRLTDCPKRSSDINLYLKIIESPNSDLRESFIEYLKTCADDLFSFIEKLLESRDTYKRKLAVCVLKYSQNQEIKSKFLDILKNENDKEVVEEILNYLSIYVLKDDVECLKLMEKKFPELRDNIREILDRA